MLILLTPSLALIHDDFPLTLDVPGVEERILLVSEPSVYYALNGSDADEQ